MKDSVAIALMGSLWVVSFVVGLRRVLILRLFHMAIAAVVFAIGYPMLIHAFSADLRGHAWLALVLALPLPIYFILPIFFFSNRIDARLRERNYRTHSRAWRRWSPGQDFSGAGRTESLGGDSGSAGPQTRYDPEYADACAALGVEPGADLEQIRRAYHEAARASHPDLRPSGDRRAAGVRMKRINAAWGLARSYHLARG